MRPVSVSWLLESTVLAMLAASAACGGEVHGGARSVDADADAERDAAVEAEPDAGRDALVETEPDAERDAAVEAEPDACAAPARGYSLTACGDQGDRIPMNGCTTVWRQLPCGLVVDAGPCAYGDVPQDKCLAFCTAAGSPAPMFPVYCSVLTYTGGASELQCGLECPGGRRPEGYGGEPSSDRHPLGRLFARLAQLETVSIGAFGALAGELERHGADATLVARARRAQRDEVRHARAAWSLARRFGARPRRLARMPKARPRSMAELAEENAAEGCVRETFGAMVASFQAKASEDESIAGTMRAIAVDEAEHARLAWDLDAFFLERLDEDGRARRALALRAALAELRRDVAAAVDVPGLGRVTGMPSRAVALLALDQLAAAIS
jgi:hypothetical protein